jgi:ketosteroid isomerase-like protein
MQQVLDDWAAAFNKEDTGKVAMHYKSDVTLFPSGNDMLQGRQNAAKPRRSKQESRSPQRYGICQFLKPEAT